MSKKLLGEIELNRIYQRDCIEGMRMIPSKSVDMILCDLPYGTTRNKWDSIIPLESLWAEYERVIKDNGAIVLTAQTPFDKVLGASNLRLLRYEWVWQKNRPTGHLNAKKMPLKEHENILVFAKKQPKYRPQGTVPTLRYIRGTTSSNYGESSKSSVQTVTSFPRSILSFSTDSNKLHPTQKPVALFEYLIKTYTNEGDVILDNCMGSGTTAIACVRNKRNFIGFELEREYVEIANKRLDAETEVNG